MEVEQLSGESKKQERDNSVLSCDLEMSVRNEPNNSSNNHNEEYSDTNIVKNWTVFHKSLILSGAPILVSNSSHYFELLVINVIFCLLINISIVIQSISVKDSYINQKP